MLTNGWMLAVEGVLKGYDQMLNLVLDDATEYLRGARRRTAETTTRRTAKDSSNLTTFGWVATCRSRRSNDVDGQKAKGGIDSVQGNCSHLRVSARRDAGNRQSIRACRRHQLK